MSRIPSNAPSYLCVERPQSKATPQSLAVHCTSPGVKHRAPRGLVVSTSSVKAWRPRVRVYVDPAPSNQTPQRDSTACMRETSSSVPPSHSSVVVMAWVVFRQAIVALEPNTHTRALTMDAIEIAHDGQDLNALRLVPCGTGAVHPPTHWSALNTIHASSRWCSFPPFSGRRTIQ